tara:strand:- start:913 stop:1113 length:201 start_codon:yes stop_codon:yes gene_type:complete
MKSSCCLCGKDLGGSGHNAFPLADGRCCDSCNYLSVIPARIKKAHHSGIIAGGAREKSGLLKSTYE